MRTKIVAGNWKMNGSRASLTEIEALCSAFPCLPCELLICPPAILIPDIVRLVEGAAIKVGGQDCHPQASGAHTGDISAPMLAEAGASFVILGHSERRQNHNEGNALIRGKAAAARAAGLVAIICVGETETERDQGQTLSVISRQLRGSVPDGATASNCVIAYEPVWAIGTGRTPSIGQIGQVHAFIRAELFSRFPDEGHGFRLLYGGSVKPQNAVDIFAVPEVDGALVGGASLKAADLAMIVAAIPA